jgi:hypothetical protein
MTLRHRLGTLGRLAFGIASVVTLELGAGIQPDPVAAATPGLTITSDATYDVLPEEGRVAVTVRLTATNHLKNTAARQFFFRSAFLTVQPGTTGYRLTGGSGTPRVAVHEIADTFTSLKLDFGANLAAGKTTKLTLTFDLRDAGGEPGRSLRISPSLVTFGAWAFATPNTPGSTVTVLFPTGYQVTVGRGPLEGPTTDEAGHDQWFSGAIRAPLEFVADVVADRPVEYSETPVEVALSGGAAAITVRAWPDDAAWSDRVVNLVKNAVPILEREIGVAWPVDGPLAVNEVLVRGSGGFAGVFDPAQRRIDISYSATDTVVIHELAHAWFNGRLVADRWAAEAFASYYAEVATRELGLDIRPPDPVEPGKGAIKLNAWGSSDAADPATELYAYAASLQLARDIAGRAGPDALRAVWLDAGHSVGAYQVDPSEPEVVQFAPDWRGLLDLLEDHTGKDFGDLWQAWVARPEDLALMAARSAARSTYAQTVEAAGEWRLPKSIRDAMRAWQFDVASDQLDAASGILDQRTNLVAAANAADVTLPDKLRAAFEGTDGLPTAAAEASAELSAVEMIAAASSAQTASNGVLDELQRGIGLVGRDPGLALGAARLALQTGNTADATAAARAARDAWQGAADAGRGRIVSAILLAVAIAIFIGLVRRGRRRRAAQPT